MIDNYKQKGITLFKSVFNGKKTQRFVARIFTLSFFLAFLIPNLSPSLASAYGQVQFRSITLSSSAIGSLTAGQNVSYAVSFVPSAISQSIGGIAIDFCSNDPIIGDSCTAPTGFVLGSGANPTIGAVSGFSTSTGAWAATQNAGKNLIWVTNATAQTGPGSLTAITFSITGVTNPTSTGPLYARILTFDTNAHTTSYTSGSIPGTGIVDAGGVALEIVSQITITSKVQEQITFCMYTSTFSISGNCSGVSGTSVTLGSSPNGVLSATTNYIDRNTKYDIQTNALHGAVIKFTGTVLTSGSNVIEASTLSGAGAAAATSYGTTCTASCSTAQFGLCTWGAGGTTANIIPVSPYNSASCSSTAQGAAGDGGANFGFNIAAAGGASGDTLANITQGPYAQGEIAFIGAITNATVAGTYTTTLTFIATGTY